MHWILFFDFHYTQNLDKKKDDYDKVTEFLYKKQNIVKNQYTSIENENVV